jgi:hypothetical protein
MAPRPRAECGARAAPEQRCLLEDAHALVDAGIYSLVLEGVPGDLAGELTEAIPVPTIGIGCGNHTCDGEVAVVTDLLGSYPWFVPPFAKPEADLAAVTEKVRRRLIRWFRRARLLNAEAAADMLAWENSGFSVDASVRIALIDRDVPSYFRSLEHLLRSCDRPAFAVQRLPQFPRRINCRLG